MLQPAATSTCPDLRLPGLSVSHRELERDACVVDVAGEVDLVSAPALKAALLELLGRGVTGFVVNLAGVDHMDSTGLSVLVGIQRRLPERGWIRIVGACPRVRRVFELTGLDRAFELYPTLEDAMLRTPPPAPTQPQPALTEDAALVVGLASTALPFADSPVAEAERWLRVLRMHGEAGRALTALGLGETPLVELPGGAGAAHEQRDPIASVTERASLIAAERGSSTVGTADLLLGVMAVYGDHFDRVLHAHGSDRGEVTRQLGLGSG